MASDPQLTGKDRALLDQILDELVPPNAARHIPGAGALGVADFVLSATPFAKDPTGAVKTVLARLSVKTPNFTDLDKNQRVSALRAVEAEEGEAFATLVRLTYMGYYSRPDTRPFFGLNSAPVHPNGYEVAPESTDFIQEITAPVRARGEIYRGT